MQQAAQTFDFTNLTQQEASQILNALADKPFRDVCGLINKLEQQASAQAQAAAAKQAAPAEVPTSENEGH